MFSLNGSLQAGQEVMIVAQFIKNGVKLNRTFFVDFIDGENSTRMKFEFHQDLRVVQGY